MGVEIKVEHLTKRFGSTTIWEDVTLTLPAGEISVMLGPSGTGKSVFLKTLIGLLKPENGSITIDGRDITKIREKDLYEVRKLFGVLFQDGALFGSQNLFDNIAFPLREHTKKSEREIKDIVMEKLDLTGLSGAEKKLPGEISGGMRKRAGLARALVLDPEILLFDEPDSGLDPVRTAYLNQLIVDLNAQIKATFLIVTHDINTARTVPDNIGLLYRRHLAMFGPREMLLSSNEPVVRQFLNAQREGPIGMAEEKDAGELASESGVELGALPPIPVQLPPSDGSSRDTARPPGQWLRENGVVPPPGSFPGLDLSFDERARAADEDRAFARPAPREPQDGDTAVLPRDGVRVVPVHRAPPSHPGPCGRVPQRHGRLMAVSALAPVRGAGDFFAFVLDVTRGLFKRPFQFAEFVQQAWFIASVTILPTALVSIPFGAVLALQIGNLTKQIGAQSFTGAVAVLGVVREASPIVTALLIVGAGGSAICADLGARKIRDEIDAMEVLGISPIARLVVPRVLATMLVAFFLNGLVAVVGVIGGYFFNVVLQGGTPGAYLASFTALAQLPDLYVGQLKAVAFGAIAGLVASYKGLNAKGGPKGVGDAVNQSVVIGFMLLFLVNFIITAVYFQLVPQKGG